MVRFCPQLEITRQEPKPAANQPAYYVDTGCLLAEAIFHPYNVRPTSRADKKHYVYVSSPICRCVSCLFGAGDCIASREEIAGCITDSRIHNLRNLIQCGNIPPVIHSPEMPLFPEKQKRNTKYKVGDLCPHCHYSTLRQSVDEHGEHLFCIPCGFYYDLTDKIGLCGETAPAANGFGKMFYGGQVE
jgi:hypothetical protein